MLFRSQQRGGVTAFEAMWPFFYGHITEHLGMAPPVPTGAAMYALIEMSGDDPAHDDARFEGLLADAVDHGIALDAAVAQSARDTESFWRIREGEPIDRLPAVINFDVSLPIADIDTFAHECVAGIHRRWPSAFVFVYGHIGDSNLHLSVSIGHPTPAEQREVDDIVYDAVRRWRGSVSAEHGIGTLKRDYLGYSRSPEEIDLMRRIKLALDPHGILNPGKVL